LPREECAICNLYIDLLPRTYNLAFDP
jgi:hypothetical protein